MVLPLVRAPQDVLSNPAKPALLFDKKLRRLIQNMKDTLASADNPKGVGLAAVQIGVPLKVFITRPKARGKMDVFINPEILTFSDDEYAHDDESKMEGCLSIPNVWGMVKRHSTVTLSWQDEKGDKHEETFDGFMATIIQHETDHLDGKVFIERVLEQKGKLYESKKDSEGKEILEEITI